MAKTLWFGALVVALGAIAATRADFVADQIAAGASAPSPSALAVIALVLVCIGAIVWRRRREAVLRTRQRKDRTGYRPVR